MARRNSATIAEVLLDTQDETFFDAKPGDTLQDLLDRGGRHLDGSSMTHVLVVKTRSGKHFVGTFEFSFSEISAKEAKKIVADYADGYEWTAADVSGSDDDGVSDDELADQDPNIGDR